MKTHVVYAYRAPESDPDQEVEIKTDVMPCEPEMALSLIQAEGQTFSFESDYPSTYGHSPKDYKVIKRYFEPGIKNKLRVIVTDAESKQPLYRDGALASARTPAPPKPRSSPEAPSEGDSKGAAPDADTEEPRRSWWGRFLFGTGISGPHSPGRVR